MQTYHTPVLVREVLDALACVPGGVYVDGTVGGGGHAFAIAEKIAPGGVLIGIDRDGDALIEAGDRLKVFGGSVRLVKGNFADIGRIVGDLNSDGVEGVLLDLGVSSHQLDVPERGFSFHQNAALDMRMDQSCGLDARTLVNTASEEEIASIIWKFGEERMARKIARAIVAKRRLTPIETTGELASIISSVMPARMKAFRIHPATRTFQALRIAVNQELENLRRGLQGSIDVLRPGGRIAVISFHSLEDRIVKDTFVFESKRCVCPPDLPVCMCGKKVRLKVLTRRPIIPGEAELSSNPRSKSAKLRVAERI